MNWKEFFKPTIGKIIIPAIIFLYEAYFISTQDLFMCECFANTIPGKIISILEAFLGIILILYPIICWIAYSIKKTKEHFKKQ